MRSAEGGFGESFLQEGVTVKEILVSPKVRED